ncbi:proline iminopeptidase [Serinibacter arcticus]|uniref:Proline iminopeptidase n=1 Tax=Serinibacter arcticus TaxID=1655435 RepID=A0A2U1ZR08_9MICO|nr:alpha/beta fold hydrolase [Serinibacter arcticus]PWD49435.1 proline iminopeptidase [Serinibacter arcticus]
MSTLTGGLLHRDHLVTVPVDRADPTRFGSIDVLAREVVDPARDGEDLPLLLFLQGGPGGQGPRPAAGGWLATATRTHRVVLLDQLGTGRSGAVTATSIARFPDAATAADYLACFRGDAIVADAEDVRQQVYGGRRWATLGQSYGGFLTLVYLSRHPDAITAAHVTGGLPGIAADAEEVYRRTFDLQLARNRELARRFPDDVTTLGALADRAEAGEVVLPTGETLSARRLQLLGMPFGVSTGVEALHWVLETGVEPDGSPTPSLRAFIAQETGFAANPLYAVLQEAIYHQGERAPGWAAASELQRRPAFATSARPLQLTGEAMFPWMFAEIPSLRPFEAVAHELAARPSWPALYDADALARNEVPLAAVQYVHDPYVDLDLALDTADAVGNSHVWVTNEFLHDGLRVSGDVILPRLLDLTAGRRSVTRR